MSSWHYSKAGIQEGPLTDVEFRNLVQANKIASTDLVWAPGMPQWERAGDIPGLLVSSASETLVLTESRSVSTPVPAYKGRSFDPVLDDSSDLMSEGEAETQGPDYESDPKFFSYRGRIRRSKYLLHVFVLAIPLSASNVMLSQSSDGEFMGILVMLGLAAMMSFPQVKRLHDLEMSGWWFWLGLIPLVNFIFGLFVLLSPGTSGSNKYGPNPRD